jgi:hypothetical protein
VESAGEGRSGTMLKEGGWRIQMAYGRYGSTGVGLHGDRFLFLLGFRSRTAQLYPAPKLILCKLMTPVAQADGG